MLRSQTLKFVFLSIIKNLKQMRKECRQMLLLYELWILCHLNFYFFEWYSHAHLLHAWYYWIFFEHFMKLKYNKVRHLYFIFSYFISILLRSLNNLSRVFSDLCLVWYGKVTHLPVSLPEVHKAICFYLNNKSTADFPVFVTAGIYKVL